MRLDGTLAVAKREYLTRIKTRGFWLGTLILPLFVVATTMTAGSQLVGTYFPAMIAAGQRFKGTMCIAMTLAVMATVVTVLLMAGARWMLVWRGAVPVARNGDKTVS